MDKTTMISTLISVAVGAIAASVPKLWDIFNEREKHRQSNQKLYFERKLNVLQTYVAVCTQLSAANYHNAIAVERMTHVDFFGEDDIMNSIVIEHLDKNAKASQEIASRMSEIASAASMFIDLKINEAESYDLIKSIHTGIADLGRIKGEVDGVIAHYNLESEPLLYSKEGEEYFQKKEVYQNHLKNIALSYGKIKEDMNRCIKLVRAEFSKYES
jgi:hypothetical protein